MIYRCAEDQIPARRSEMNELLAAGELARALEAALAILAEAPVDVEARICAARVYLGQDQMERAACLLLEGINNDPGQAGYWALLGEVQTVQGQNAAAIDSYRHALTLIPDWTEISNNLAALEWSRGRKSESMEILRQAVERNPGCAITRLNLSRMQNSSGDADAALRSIEAAIQISPKWALTHFERARLLDKAGNTSASLAAYDRALELDSLWPDAYLAKGLALRAASRIPEALECFHQAAMLRPDWHLARHNIGEAHLQLGQTHKAIETFREAVRLSPGFNASHASLAVALLQHADFDEGWPEWEWRFAQAGNIPQHPDSSAPIWDGRSLAGETLMVWMEQGLGDIIQFSRFASAAADRGARVLLQAPPPLGRLLATLPGVTRIVMVGERSPECDFQIPLMSLPHVLNVGLDQLPGRIPYLRPPPDEQDAGQILEDPRENRFRVGIVWASNQSDPVHRERDCDFSLLSGVAAVPGVAVFSLQFGDRAADLSRSPRSLVRSLSAEIGDFARTSAFVLEMDLIITVDTAMAHLAGALGKKVWVLLAEPADWRWMRDRPDSPWYPTARLLRQTRRGDWEELMDRLLSALAEEVCLKSERSAHGDRRGPNPRSLR
jgi:tetratricopeptide (TPR) repeat protein